jgi:hypothetical protein
MMFLRISRLVTGIESRSEGTDPVGERSLCLLPLRQEEIPIAQIGEGGIGVSPGTQSENHHLRGRQGIRILRSLEQVLEEMATLQMMETWTEEEEGAQIEDVIWRRVEERGGHPREEGNTVPYLLLLLLRIQEGEASATSRRAVDLTTSSLT